MSSALQCGHGYDLGYDQDGRLENPRAVAEGFEPEISVRPLRLHTQQVEQGGPASHGGGLGGHCFSTDFARYLARVRPRLAVVRDAQVRYWWASAYGRARVERAFLQRFGEAQGKIAYRVALIIASDFWGSTAYARLMAETGHTASWIADKGLLALKVANARSSGGDR